MGNTADTGRLAQLSYRYRSIGRAPAAEPVWTGWAETLIYPPGLIALFVFPRNRRRRNLIACYSSDIGVRR
jgi:hypothetical protein